MVAQSGERGIGGGKNRRERKEEKGGAYREKQFCGFHVDGTGRERSQIRQRERDMTARGI